MKINFLNEVMYTKNLVENSTLSCKRDKPGSVILKEPGLLKRVAGLTKRLCKIKRHFCQFHLNFSYKASIVILTLALVVVKMPRCP